MFKTDVVNINFAESGEAIFRYNGSNITSSLSTQEMSEIYEIFSNKRMYRDNPSCGFSENISLKINNLQTFCFANDTCPIVYWKEKDKYFKVTENEKKQLYNILQNHGFIFPCV